MASDLFPALVAGASLALVSAVHCAVMCGPIALTTRVRGGAPAVATYFFGRVVSYAILGALAGSVGRAVMLSAWGRWAEALFAWLLAATLAFVGASLLLPTRHRDGLVKLRKKPSFSLIGRILARVADDPLLLGVATALLPCGALYSALAAAALLGTPAAGAVAMTAFAAVSGLAVVGVSQLGAGRATQPRLRKVVGVALVAGALLFVYRPVPFLRGGVSAPTCHQTAAAPEAR